jgi:hypothetical protein
MISLMLLEALAQNRDVVQFCKSINKDIAYKHLSVLASDKFNGRATGAKGGWMAANYIKRYFKNIGLKGPVSSKYFQSSKLSYTKYSQSLKIGNKVMMEWKDFLPGEVTYSDFILNADKLLFFSYDFNVDPKISIPSVEGRLVLIVHSLKLRENVKYLRDHGAAGILVANRQMDFRTDEIAKSRSKSKNLHFSSSSSEKVNQPYISLNTKTANLILQAGYTSLEKISRDNKPIILNINIPIKGSFSCWEEPVKADNVLVFFEGSDPVLKNEILVISSHYDHLGGVKSPPGMDKIANGADDNGSGTTGLLMIANAFMQAKAAGKGPKRSILFVTFTGEELGKLGSQWYTDHPVFPLENTIANLNIDMIGRGDKEHENNKDFVYIIGSNMLSSDLHEKVLKANQEHVNLVLDERFNNRTDPNQYYYRSDHYNFAKHRIPVIFFFNGVHEDYHKPSDEIKKIDFPRLVKRTELVYYTAWELANAPVRPKVDKD